MSIPVYIQKSNYKKYKYKAMFPTHTINFGDRRYEDYTTHHDEKRKALYIKRHQAREDWDDIETAGALSRFILWEKPTIEESIKYLNQIYKDKYKFIYT